MSNNQMIKTAEKVISIHRLREEAPSVSSRNKEDFVNYIYDNNKKRLEWLVAYYTQLKKRNAFFASSKEALDLKRLVGRKIRDPSTDLIFEFNVTFGDALVVVSVKAHSGIYEYNVEEPEKLTPMDVRFRKGFTIYFVYHVEDSILEVKTRSAAKYEILARFLEHTLHMSEDSIVLLKINESEYKKIDSLIRYKSLTASGLNIAGANKISIEGDDVEQTLEYFKSRRIDLKDCSEFSLKKAVTDKKSITFFDSGKVTYRPIVDDIYSELRQVLLDHAKQIRKR